ncbi:MAG: crotonase/enoyl-CoA hydratase family protein [Sulfitobacter sp.]|nr:crotonase/enoyl-CoA hydratase family protein [Sulfitobacter sp.]
MTVEIRQEGKVTVVMINRPAARNAVNPETAQALFDAFIAFEADDHAEVAILTGADGAFCAGFDLKTAADGSAARWIEEVVIPPDWEDPVGRPLPGPMGPSRLMLSKPVIAAVEGPAVAGGMELALWCDLRVMAEDANMGIYCRRWGVPLIDGGTFRLPRVVGGQGIASDLVLTGRPIGAEEAAQVGLSNRTVPTGTALGNALALAEELTRFPQGCMRADHLSSRMPPSELAAALRREWVSSRLFHAEGQAGAARFAAGKGRGGDFGAI